MRIRNRYLFITACVATLVLSTLLAIRLSESRHTIILDPSSLDFGTVTPGEVVVGHVAVTNPTQSLIYLDSFTSPCNCTALEFRPAILYPGQRIAYTIRYLAGSEEGEMRNTCVLRYRTTSNQEPLSRVLPVLAVADASKTGTPVVGRQLTTSSEYVNNIVHLSPAVVVIGAISTNSHVPLRLLVQKPDLLDLTLDSVTSSSQSVVIHESRLVNNTLCLTVSVTQKLNSSAEIFLTLHDEFDELYTTSTRIVFRSSDI